MWFARHDLVEMIVWSLFPCSSSNIFKSSLLGFLVDFGQFQAILNSDIPLLEFFLEEGITRIIIMYESVIGIDDSEVSEWGLSAMSLLPFRYSLEEEEIIVLDFSRERVLGDAEIGLAMVEVVEPSGVLVL